MPVVGAASWLLTLPYFAVEAVVAAAAGPYHPWPDTVSKLGVTSCTDAFCSPLHGWLNASFMALGLLTATGMLLLRRDWPPTGTATAGVVLVVVASASTVATGLFPVDAGTAAHAVASLPQFPLQNVGIVLLGVAEWRVRRGRAVLSLLCGGVGLAGLVLFVAATPLGIGLGGMERLSAYPLSVWTTVVAVAVLARRR